MIYCICHPFGTIFSKKQQCSRQIFQKVKKNNNNMSHSTRKKKSPTSSRFISANLLVIFTKHFRNGFSNLWRLEPILQRFFHGWQGLGYRQHLHLVSNRTVECGGIAGSKRGSVQEEDEVRLLTTCLAGLGWNELNELEISRLAMMIQNHIRQVRFCKITIMRLRTNFTCLVVCPPVSFGIRMEQEIIT